MRRGFWRVAHDIDDKCVNNYETCPTCVLLLRKTLWCLPITPRLFKSIAPSPFQR
jgi:hypothetical protein